MSTMNGSPLHKNCKVTNKVRALHSDGCLYYRDPTDEERAHWNDKSYWRRNLIHRDGTDAAACEGDE